MRKAWARVAAAWLVATLSLAGALGILYLLRHAGALALGPRVAGALPLQQLAGDDVQPLLRMLIAWLPAGAVAGVTLARLGRVRPSRGLPVLALLAAVVLLGAGAAADAVAVSESLAPHLAPQLHRAGTWVAVAILLGGAALAWAPGRFRPCPAVAPTAR